MSLKEFMAARCEHCPMCRFARERPEHWFGRLMHWHGQWCPFWKAWNERYGNGPKTTGA